MVTTDTERRIRIEIIKRSLCFTLPFIDAITSLADNISYEKSECNADYANLKKKHLNLKIPVFHNGKGGYTIKSQNDSGATEVKTKRRSIYDETVACSTTGFGFGIGSAVVNGAINAIYTNRVKTVRDQLSLHPFPQNVSDPIKKKTLWESYRRDMIKETGISIFMFGNKKGAAGNTINSDGCIQEFEIAKEFGNIIIPIGSTGYAAEKIYNEVKTNIANYPYLIDYMSNLGSETDIDRIVDIVLAIIRHQEK